MTLPAPVHPVDPAPAAETPAAVPVTAFRLAASVVSRAAGVVSRASGRGDGAVIGGRILGRFPHVARRLAAGRRVVLVSGTNGKTTTTTLLARAMATAGPVTSNATGANTRQGIITALASSRTPTVVLECDEAWLPWCVEQTRPDVVVLLNLSRDQLDRHHEVAALVGRWREAVAAVPLVVANADDPNTVWAAGGAEHQVWVSGHPGWTGDSVLCPQCRSLLSREGRDWSCGICGLRRPEPDWSVTDSVVTARAGTVLGLDLALPGRVNQDNATAAMAAAQAFGVDPAAALACFADVAAVAGRYSVVWSGDHRVRLLLAKNPAGWVEALAVSASSGGSVALAVNAREVDGRDPSWLWDVDFASLRGRPVVVSGDRALDAAVRLEVDEVDVLDSHSGVIAALGALPPGPVDLIATYTAFDQARQELAGGR